MAVNERANAANVSIPKIEYWRLLYASLVRKSVVTMKRIKKKTVTEHIRMT
ncbi:MAG: hypothetical protein J0L67_08085 [Cytophagales bacterium]|nr:hypothetical protein [Cytophagales bacterium]